MKAVWPTDQTIKNVAGSSKVFRRRDFKIFPYLIFVFNSGDSFSIIFDFLKCFGDADVEDDEKSLAGSHVLVVHRAGKGNDWMKKMNEWRN